MSEVSKKKTLIWVLVIGVVVVGTGFGIGIPLYNNYNTPPPTPEVQHIDVHEAKAMIDDNTTYPNLIVLDIRLDYEYNEEHLIDAWWIPWDVGDANYTGGIDALEGYENTEIIVYCRTGNRSVAGSQFLIDAGYTKIYNMIGGISEWKAAGYAVVTP